MALLNQVVLLVFPLLMAFAASSDLLTMRISNKLVLVLVVSFLGLAVFSGMSLQELALHVTCAVAVLVVAFCFFAMRWVGGGDAKLAAATALWLGFAVTLPYLLYAAVLGGALTLILLSARRLPLPSALAKITWIDRLHNKKTGIPYGIALAAAGIIVYSDTALFQQLTSIAS